MVPEGWQRLPLDHVAFIQTVLAKSQKDLKAPVEFPYFRVANVQDGYLYLANIKLIKVEKSNFDRYLLCRGDVLLTDDRWKIQMALPWMSYMKLNQAT